EAPRALDFVSQPGNLGQLRALLRRGGDPRDMIPAFDRFLDRNPGLTPAEQLDAVRRLGELLDLARARGMPLPNAIEEATAIGGRPGSAGGGAQAATALRNLVQDDVIVPVARRMLEPPQPDIAAVETAGPGALAPDVLFTTTGGQDIGREATSSN